MKKMPLPRGSDGSTGKLLAAALEKASLLTIEAVSAVGAP
jgi:hypothetical protein